MASPCRLAVSGLRGVGLLVAQRALHTPGIKLVAVNDPHLTLEGFLACLNEHPSASAQGLTYSYFYEGKDQESDTGGPFSERVCTVDVKKRFPSKLKGDKLETRHIIRWYAKEEQKPVAWRGDNAEGEANVNVHVLIDCLSRTVRGAQAHAGPGCSVVILLASAPRALALGPSVHELCVLQAGVADPEVPAHRNRTRLYSAGSCATRAMAVLAKMIHSEWGLRDFAATCICVSSTTAPALLATEGNETLHAPLCLPFSYPESEAGIVDVQTTPGLDGAPEVTVTPGRRPTPII